MHGQRSGEQAVGAQALAGFMEELAEDRPCFARIAELGRQDMAVTDGFLRGHEIWGFIATDEMPEPIAHHPTPDMAQ